MSKQTTDRPYSSHVKLNQPFWIVLFLIAAVSGAAGQVLYGSLTGTVADPSGAVEWREGSGGRRDHRSNLGGYYGLCRHLSLHDTSSRNLQRHNFGARVR